MMFSSSERPLIPLRNLRDIQLRIFLRIYHANSYGGRVANSHDFSGIENATSGRALANLREMGEIYTVSLSKYKKSATDKFKMEYPNTFYSLSTSGMGPYHLADTRQKGEAEKLLETFDWQKKTGI